MKYFRLKKMVSIVFIFLSLSIIPKHSLFGWAPQVQGNYLKEAIRILPWFQYLMCKDYKNSLIEGIVEAEYQFWFMNSGNCPGLANNIKDKKINFIKGWNFQEKDIEKAAEYFYEKFEGLRSDIKKGDKRYSEIMFELGYHLHSINNSLKPPYFHKINTTKEERYYHSHCTRLAQNTEEIELRTENVEDIKDLKSWLESMLSKNLMLREKWHKAAEADKNSFEKYTNLASERNIYNLASIINYVLIDLKPMTPEMQKFLYDKINRKFKGGRKPGID